MYFRILNYGLQLMSLFRLNNITKIWSTWITLLQTEGNDTTEQDGEDEELLLSSTSTSER